MNRVLPSILVAGMAAELAAEPYDPFDPDLNCPVMVRTQVEFVELEQATYLKLMQRKQGSANATALRKQVGELVNRDQAEVLETMFVVCRSGEKATVESISERIYPSEYEPPGLPCNFGSSPRDLLSGTFDYRPLASLPTVPTSFETRNVGGTLEVAPCIGVADEVVDVRINPELVRFAGYNIHLEREDHQGTVHQDKHPIFETRKVVNAVTCRVGQYVLLTTLPAFSVADEVPRKLMVFLKCDILKVTESRQ